jgi:hypothetical protein
MPRRVSEGITVTNKLQCVVAAPAGTAFGVMLPDHAGAQGWNLRRNVEVTMPSNGSLDSTGRTITRIWGDLKLLPASMRQTPSLPNSDARSGRPRSGARESRFLAVQAGRGARTPV